MKTYEIIVRRQDIVSVTVQAENIIEASSKVLGDPKMQTCKPDYCEEIEVHAAKKQ